MAYDTTEAVAKFLSGFQMEITNRERDTVAPDYYVKYSLTLSKGGKDFSTTFVSDPGASGEPTVTQVFSALADDALTLRKYSTDEFVDKHLGYLCHVRGEIWRRLRRLCRQLHTGQR